MTHATKTDVFILRLQTGWGPEADAHKQVAKPTKVEKSLCSCKSQRWLPSLFAMLSVIWWACRMFFLGPKALPVPGELFWAAGCCVQVPGKDTGQRTHSPRVSNRGPKWCECEICMNPGPLALPNTCKGLTLGIFHLKWSRPFNLDPRANDQENIWVPMLKRNCNLFSVLETFLHSH